MGHYLKANNIAYTVCDGILLFLIRAVAKLLMVGGQKGPTLINIFCI